MTSRQPKATDSFRGFSPLALKFLRDLAKHNKREWFVPRKATFEAELLAPLEALVSDATDAMRKAKIPFGGIPGRAPFRIYRDIRFSKDKSPYKTNLGAYLSPTDAHREPGGFYVHIQPGKSFMAVAFYALDKPQLDRWRRTIAENPKRFEAMRKALERNGVKLSEEHVVLKRLPRGYEAFAASPIERFLRTGSFMVSEMLSDKDVSSPRLIDKMVALAKKAKPLIDYGRAIG